MGKVSGQKNATAQNTVIVRKKEYAGWKNCIEVSNGLVDIIATTDVGPRIIRFGFCGKENEFCEVKEQMGKTGENEWRIYGGHRLWHSPEKMPRTYHPDNSPVTWKKAKDGIILEQQIEPWTYIKKEIEVTMTPGKAEVSLLHRLTNKGAWEVELSAWALTVMAPGGIEVVPFAACGKDKLLPDRMLSLWPYTKLNDRRIYWGEKYITLRQDKLATKPFKVGLPNNDGWAAYANNGRMFVKYFDFEEDVLYPDYSASSYETYTIDFMLEMESLSPLVLLEPEESFEHRETWRLFDNVNAPQNEKEIEQYILPLVKNKKIQ